MSSRILIGSLILLAVTWCCNKGADHVAVQPKSNYLEAGEGSMFVSVTATKAWTLSLEYPSGTEAWATVDPASGTGSLNDVRLRFQANAAESERRLTLVLNGQGAQASATITQAGVAPDPGPDTPGSRGYGYDVAPGSLAWLELPATKAGDGCELLIHNMQGGRYAGQAKDGVRNWSCYWNYDEHMSLWVAYPHNNSLKGSGGRSDEWGVYDPCLPTSLQPNMAKTYGGGWTRGHQIPSADRLGSYAANVSTFYPTNMTPQEYNFNAGIWANLEAKVRAYAASCDTLYVVTGALFDQSVQYSGSNSGFRVKVPTHYFKALLAHTTGGTQGQDGYLAAGFLLPHDASIANGKFGNYICSIDQLEDKTGIDFFPNLIRKIGEEKAGKVESATPGNWWK